MKEKRKNIGVMLIILIILIFGLRLLNVEGKLYIQNYIIDYVSFAVMLGVFFVVWSNSHYDIFDPFFFVSIIYIMLFTVTPMIDLSIREINWYGVDLFPYGIKGTLIALIGYIMFAFFYKNSVVFHGKKMWKEDRICSFQYDKNKVLIYTLGAWIVCFGCTMLYFISSGKGIQYVLSLGFLGDVADQNITESASVGFLSMFSYSLITLCLVYNQFSENKLISGVLFYITLIIQLLRGFRFIVLILVLAFFINYYLQRKKRPSLKIVIVLLAIIIFAIGIMGFYRAASRTGTMNTLNWNEFNSQAIVDAIFDNFRIYKTYYAVIKSVPDIIPHMFGKQMFIYTIIMFIPRFIWSGKPNNPGMDAIKVGISDYAAKAGQAYPNIGEFYYEFGIIGVIIFMAFFGWLLRKIKYHYFYSDDILDRIVIAIWIPATFQLIIRGYTPSNFYLLVFLLLPIWIIRRLCRRKL